MFFCRCTWTCWLPRIRSSGTTWSPTPTGRRIPCLWELWDRPARILLDLLGKMQLCMITGDGLCNSRTVLYQKYWVINNFSSIFFSIFLYTGIAWDISVFNKAFSVYLRRFTHALLISYITDTVLFIFIFLAWAKQHVKSNDSCCCWTPCTKSWSPSRVAAARKTFSLFSLVRDWRQTRRSSRAQLRQTLLSFFCWSKSGWNFSLDIRYGISRTGYE